MAGCQNEEGITYPLKQHSNIQESQKEGHVSFSVALKMVLNM